MIRRATLLGPFSIRALREFLPDDSLTRLPSGAGGAALVNLALARLELGWPTDIITLDAQAPVQGCFVEHGPLRLWIMPRRPARAMRDLFRDERAALHRALDAAQPEVCHAHWTYEYGLAAVEHATSPTVVTVHDHAGHMLRWCGPRFLPLYIMTRRVFRAARHLSAVSPETAAYAQRISGKPVKVIANCISHGDTQRTNRHEISDQPRIAGAWSWARYRNTRRGLRVFAAMRKRYPKASLHLMGMEMHAGGPADRWAQRHGLADGVTFHGVPPWNIALQNLLSSDVVFHPSLEESFSLPVAESLARGVPVVAARQAAGPAWLVEQCGNGILVDGTSEPALTEALVSCIEGGNQGSSPEGIARIRQLCEPRSVLREYNDVYEDAISCHKMMRHE